MPDSAITVARVAAISNAVTGALAAKLGDCRSVLSLSARQLFVVAAWVVFASVTVTVTVGAASGAQPPRETPVSPEPAIFAVNCGGRAVESALGHLFQEDGPYLRELGYGFLDDRNSNVVQGRATVIDGTRDGALLATARVAPDSLHYRFDLAPGPYVVVLRVADLLGHHDSANRYDCWVERDWRGLVEPHWPNRKDFASTYAWPVEVADGVLDLVLRLHEPRSRHEQIQVSAIEVFRAASLRREADPGGAPAVVGVDDLQVTPSYGAVVARWSESVSPGSYDLEAIPIDSQSGTPAPRRWRLHTTRMVVPSPPGSPIKLRVRAANAFGDSSAWSEVITASILEPPTLPIYRIEIAPDSLRDQALALQENEPHKIYRRGNLVAGGERYEGVRHRYRGNSTLSLSKSSRLVNFRAEQPSPGGDRLILNSAGLDFTLQRERSAFELWRVAGQPASDVRPVTLFVNDQYEGVYQEIEQVDERFLVQRGLSVDGTLYKCYGRFLMEDIPRAAELYEHKWGPARDRGRIVELIRDLNSVSDRDLVRYFEKSFDLRNVLTWYALNVLLANPDFSNQNYYLYRNPGGRWLIIPWDMDLSWGNPNDLEGMRVRFSITYGSRGDKHTTTFWVNQLITRIVEHPVLFRSYLERLVELRETVFQGAERQPMLDRFHEELLVAASADPWKLGGEGLGRVAEAGQYYREFLTARGREIDAEITRIRSAEPPTR